MARLICQGDKLEVAGNGNAAGGGSMVAALQDALEACRLAAGQVLRRALPIQLHTHPILLLLAELVHLGLALLVPNHNQACCCIHLHATCHSQPLAPAAAPA